jgi:protocatechuate 3,4-dioxygenase, beta subunit
MQSRRTFLFSGAGLMACAGASVRAGPLPECEWCGASEAPPNLTASIILADRREPGERLLLQGTVYATDRVTPVPGILLYAYHTNAAGLYPRRGNETGNGRRHGYLRGWLISDEQGRYEIRSIRPGHYPNRSSPQHIHITVTEPRRPEYWIDDVNFEGDPLITEEYRARLEGRGGPGIVTLTRSASGEWLARRDIILK